MCSLACYRLKKEVLLLMNSNCKRIIQRTIKTHTIFDFVEHGKLIDIPIENIRNFSVIAHVDHGIYIII